MQIFNIISICNDELSYMFMIKIKKEYLPEFLNPVRLIKASPYVVVEIHLHEQVSNRILPVIFH